MKLYNWQPAPNPRRVRMFLAEKGIQIPVEEVGDRSMKLRPDFVARFDPYATVPVLELDDGTCIGEAMAICRYFEELHPEPRLMGRDAKDKALVEMWERRAYESGMLGLSEALRNTHAAFAGRGLPGTAEPVQQIPDIVERGKGRLHRFYQSFDEQLATRRFVTGSEFTVADITAFTVVDFLERAKMAQLPPDFAHMRRWYDEVGTRESAKA